MGVGSGARKHDGGRIPEAGGHAEGGRAARLRELVPRFIQTGLLEKNELSMASILLVGGAGKEKVPAKISFTIS